MNQLEDVRIISCVRCKTVLFGDRSAREHFAACDNDKRLEDALEALSGLGYDSLSFEQIKELFSFLNETDLNGDIVADRSIRSRSSVIVVCSPAS
jgi:hypothetical protein